MPTTDLNLLVTLNALLAEGSVVGGARRLRLSSSAMSRALARLRESTGDPLLVRAGRGLVPTPRALELRDRVGQLVDEAQAMLRPATKLDLSTLDRIFTLRVSDGFVETFAPALIERVDKEANRVRLRFIQKTNKDSSLLRDGSVDLETGVIGGVTGPEVRIQLLFRDRFVGVMRARHPLARLKSQMTALRYAGASHIMVSRRGDDRGPIDDSLQLLGLQRQVAIIVGGFAQALSLVRETDLIATVPERHTAALRKGMTTFALPVKLPETSVSMMWHPRMQADPAHRWLRGCVQEVCHREQSSPSAVIR